MKLLQYPKIQTQYHCIISTNKLKPKLILHFLILYIYVLCNGLELVLNLAEKGDQFDLEIPSKFSMPLKIDFAVLATSLFLLPFSFPLVGGYQGGEGELCK